MKSRLFSLMAAWVLLIWLMAGYAGAASVSGTTWYLIYEDDGEPVNYEVQFRPDGAFKYDAPHDKTPNNDFWEQHGENVLIYINDRYSTYTGRVVNNDLITGTAKNIRNASWSFEIRRNIKEQPRPVSLSGTQWMLKETIGGEPSQTNIEFSAGGRFTYDDPTDKTPNNDFWRQYKDTVFIKLNDNYVKYSGRVVSDRLIKGMAINKEGSRWGFTMQR